MGNKILICDDHSLVLQTLKEFIEQKAPNLEINATEDFDLFKQYLSGEEKPDLAIVDLRMPGISDLETIQKLIENPQKVPVAVMSGFANRSEIVQFMQWGAIGFIPKTVSGMGLINAINLMLCGEPYVPSALLDESKTLGNEDVELTQRETDVLRLLHLGKSNKEIAKQLFIEEITVKVYVSRLCKKLHAKNRTQVVVNAIAKNLIG